MTKFAVFEKWQQCHLDQWTGRKSETQQPDKLNYSLRSTPANSRETTIRRGYCIYYKKPGNMNEQEHNSSV